MIIIDLIYLCQTLHVLSIKHEYLCNYLMKIKYIIEKNIKIFKICIGYNITGNTQLTIEARKRILLNL